MQAPRTEVHGNAVGLLLVALQFALLGGLAVSAARAWPDRPLPPAVAALAAAALLLGLWALTANRPGNFNIRPQPRAGGRLVRHGPYRWIRHPMYTSLMLAGLAAARLAGDGLTWLALGGLVAVLFAKSGVEERALAARFPDYQDYRRRTRRFIPWLI
jgi:protein-S-isoprenylcysteine O-methyltransferase Ste14